MCRTVSLLALLPIALIPVCLAQSAKNAACPTLSMDGPFGIFEAGDIKRMTALLDGKRGKSKYEYKWTVSDGDIVDGQGTSAIQVRMPESLLVKATFKIVGLPATCSDTASEFFQTTGPEPTPEEVGRVEGSDHFIGDELLKKTLTVAEEFPASQIYLLICVKEGESAAQYGSNKILCVDS